MRYIEIAEEKGCSWDGCNGRSDWVRFVHVITASTKKDLQKQKENIKKVVDGLSGTYFSVYLNKWQTLEEYNKSY